MPQRRRCIGDYMTDQLSVVVEAISTVFEAYGETLEAARRLGGFDVISPISWKRPISRRAVAVVTHDGGIAAPFFNWSYEQHQLIEAIRKAFELRGLYVEGEECWYSVVYPIALESSASSPTSVQALLDAVDAVLANRTDPANLDRLAEVRQRLAASSQSV